MYILMKTLKQQVTFTFKLLIFEISLVVLIQTFNENVFVLEGFGNICSKSIAYR